MEAPLLERTLLTAGKLAVCSLFLSLNFQLHAVLLVDPTDAGNTNNTIFTDDSDYDDEYEPIVTALPAGLFF